VLDLTGQHIGPAGARDIARLPEARNLRWLGLADSGIGPDGAAELADSPHLNLHHLDVRGNDLDLSELDALQRRFPDARIEMN
jgi:hypothetical protein